MDHRDSPLSVEHVCQVFAQCLAHGAESHPTVTVEGILHTANFAMNELERRKAEIGGMLAQLPLEFQPRADGGADGWSFLNACNDRDGRQWTGEHMIMEQLFLLGIATGQAKWCLPRDMWEVLPGQMPYIAVVSP
jgi:hypothetical protein